MNTLHHHVLAFAVGALLLPTTPARADDLEGYWEDRQEALEEYAGRAGGAVGR